MTCHCATPAEHTARAVRAGQQSAAAALRSKEAAHAREIAELRAALGVVAAKVPDASDYEVLEVARVGDHLVMKLRYACACAFNGEKILVFTDVNETMALRWRKIDPHFREEAPANLSEAPSPAARFPATADGWKHAVDWARSIRGGVR